MRISEQFPFGAHTAVGATSLMLLVAACGSPDQRADTAEPAQSKAQASAVDDGRIPCARGQQPMVRNCTVDQVQGPGGLTLTIRHPDGGFRRLQVTQDGRGVVAADGAESAKVAVLGPGDIEVTVAGDRYRLPATIK